MIAIIYNNVLIFLFLQQNEGVENSIDFYFSSSFFNLENHILFEYVSIAFVSNVSRLMYGVDTLVAASAAPSTSAALPHPRLPHHRMASATCTVTKTRNQTKHLL